MTSRRSSSNILAFCKALELLLGCDLSLVNIVNVCLISGKIVRSDQSVTALKARTTSLAIDLFLYGHFHGSYGFLGTFSATTRRSYCSWLSRKTRPVFPTTIGPICHLQFQCNVSGVLTTVYGALRIVDKVLSVSQRNPLILIGQEEIRRWANDLLMKEGVTAEVFSRMKKSASQ